MKISQVLREAKPLLKHYEFVCSAINYCDASYNDRVRARRYVEKSICPWGTVSIWLLSQGIAEKHLTDINLYNYRHRWINHMIVELEKDGR